MTSREVTRAKLTDVSERPFLVATLDGFAVEGGFDGPGQPATCYGAATQLGQCPATGDARGLWRDYEVVIDLAKDLGLDGVRLTLEWARLEPHPDQPDRAAFDRYRRALTHARSLGLRVTGVLVDVAWPSWLGPEAWLLPWVPERVMIHAERVGELLGDALDAVVDFARPDDLITTGFRDGSAPPWRRRADADARVARTALRDLHERLRTSSTLGPLLLDSYREVPVVNSPSALRALITEGSAAAELHLRSLVGGVGPAPGPGALLTNINDTWQVGVDEELVEVLRR